jgi:hypothetical protein
MVELGTLRVCLTSEFWPRRSTTTSGTTQLWMPAFISVGSEMVTVTGLATRMRIVMYVMTASCHVGTIDPERS